MLRRLWCPSPDKDSINMSLQTSITQYREQRPQLDATSISLPPDASNLRWEEQRSFSTIPPKRLALRLCRPATGTQPHFPTMAPSSAPSTSVTLGKTRLRGTASASREATPTASKPSPGKMPKTRSDTEVAGLLKTDLVAIRDLATCSICDQLLYEPWTLACGHTYCYSCLCNWFVPNKRKKTCPECRAKVKTMPGPNFLVKQMVEVLMKRKEILPDDESAEQHYQKKLEEIGEVEKDRNGPDGLFKGTFPARKIPWRDEADGVMRCPDCGHEHEGGPACENCGIELDVDDFFSDIDEDFDADALDDGLDSGLDEIEAEFAEHQGHPYLAGIPRPRPWHAFVQHYHHHHHRYPTTDRSDGSDMGSDEEENEGSLHGFVVPDDEEPVRIPGRNPNHRPVITISDDDDSDEGGAVSNRRPQRRGRQAGNIPPAAPSVISLTTTSTNVSEAGDEADMLRYAGWSPLDQGNESELDGYVDYRYDDYHTGDGVTEDDQDEDEDSDTNTETMAANPPTDDEDDNRSRSNPYSYSRSPSCTPGDDHPRPPHPDFEPYSSYYQPILRRDPEEHFDADSELEHSSDLEQFTDRDGDTEMTPSRASRSVSVASTTNANPYARNPYSESKPNRGVNLSANNDYGGVSESSMGVRGESLDNIGHSQNTPNLGEANAMHEIEGGSSDSSIRPPPRRLPRRYHPNSRGQQYDPRISQMFAEHQQSLRGTRDNTIGLDDFGWDDEVYREPASRHRRMTAYRNMLARRVDPLRSSRSPSATRIISVADRSSRIPRQYRRN